MGALGHFLEDEGIATTGISLVREHTARIRPPRALWVPFILGRPFGVPGNAAFQRRVVERALGLLEAESGPVLEDFFEDAPTGSEAESVAFACPVSFSPEPATDDASAFEEEIATLTPWHDLAVERRGRTAARLSGLSPTQAGRFITDFIADPSRPAYREDLDRGLALRLASEDIKAFYLEAVNAQPGQTAAREANAWFWNETTAGRVLQRLCGVAIGHSDRSVQTFGEKHLVPRAVLNRGRSDYRLL